MSKIATAISSLWSELDISEQSRLLDRFLRKLPPGDRNAVVRRHVSDGLIPSETGDFQNYLVVSKCMTDQQRREVVDVLKRLMPRIPRKSKRLGIKTYDLLQILNTAVLRGETLSLDVIIEQLGLAPDHSGYFRIALGRRIKRLSAQLAVDTRNRLSERPVVDVQHDDENVRVLASW